MYRYQLLLLLETYYLITSWYFK